MSRRLRSTTMRALVLVVVVVAAGCTTAPGGTGTPTGTAPPTAGPTEQAPVPRTEDPGQVETGAGGPDGISVEIAGLPVGGGLVIDQDGTWCQVLFWGSATATGTVVEVHTVRTGTPGATVRDFGCEGAPPCVGAVLVDGAGSCAIAVTPPTPDVDQVLVALDATVRCEVRTACDAVQGSDGWTAVTNPTGGSAGTQESGGTSDESPDEGPDQSPDPTDGEATDPVATP